MENNIQINSIINHSESNGRFKSNRVIRVEADSYIIEVPTIGGSMKERSIHISEIVSYTNRVVHKLV